MTAPAVQAVMPAPEAPGFGLYIHWPFCLAKCPYCDFNSHVRQGIDHGRWRRALLRELAHFAEKTPGRRLTSIFFGGGTPSLMAPDTLAALIEAASCHWDFSSDIEITLEANPTSSEAESFDAFAAAGVNRMSIGVQALDDEALAFLGRQHSAAEALRAVELARRHVGNLSLDLIYARPGQTAASWRAEMASALAEAPDHISLYQLTIEEGTRFHAARRRGELLELPEEEAAELFDMTREVLAEAGLPAYEVSNHARANAACRHNLTYWRYQDYLGIGPGAHGRITLDGSKVATRQHRAPEAWLAAVEKRGHATRQEDALDQKARLSEMVMMGLRLSNGIQRSRFHEELGQDPEALLPAERLAQLQDAGYLQIDEAGMRASETGILRLNALLAYLLA